MVLGAFVFPPIDELFVWKDILFEDTFVRDQQDEPARHGLVAVDPR